MGTLAPAAKQDVALQRLRWIVRVFDEAFVVPGTSFRVGLDPILGLVPGVGDVAGAVAAVAFVIIAATAGTPPRLLAAMAANVLLEAGVGFVPLFGDAFDFAFRANRRNLALFEAHLARRAAPRFASPWTVLLTVALGAAFLALLAAIAAGLAVYTISRWVRAQG